MTQLLFHLDECGDVTLDEEGVDLPDIGSAMAVAREAARAIMAAEVGTGHLCLSCHIRIQDGAGRQLATVPFRDALDISGY